MEIGDWKATPELNSLYRELRELELETNVAELEAYGFTVVPPEKVAPSGFAEKLRESVLGVAERRSGVRPDVDAGSTHSDRPRPTGEHLFYLLWEDPIFEEAVQNPAALGLISYLLGQNAVISSVTSIIKGPGKTPLPLHSDNARIPPPFPTYSQVANATWVLSEYTKENGALCFVPGSHRQCRQPTLAEMMPVNNPSAIPVEAPVGSLVVWHGNTWHGAFPRTEPGLRINLIMYFCRVYMRPQEAYRENVPEGALDRNPDRFRRLLGLHDTYGWKEEGPDYARLNIATQTIYA